MKEVSCDGCAVKIDGKCIDEMTEEEAKQNLCEIARQYKRIKLERNNYRKKAKTLKQHFGA